MEDLEKVEQEAVKIRTQINNVLKLKDYCYEGKMTKIKFIREGGTATYVRMVVDGKNNGVYLRKQFPGFSPTFTFYPDDLDLKPSYNSREQERLEKLFQMYLKELKMTEIPEQEKWNEFYKLQEEVKELKKQLKDLQELVMIQDYTKNLGF
jgi:hypothetical protein